MPKSLRHRSSKHSSRDARDYSDSDNDSSPKERRGGSDDVGGGARASKDLGYSDKRKIDSKDKDLYGSGNGEYAEEHGSSKRRKEKVSDRASDRWNGGSEEGLNKVKPSSESKSRRRDEESEDVKRSGKSEMHRESSRKEGRDSERKEREGRGDKSIDNEDIATDSKAVASTEPEVLEKRGRRKKDNFDDVKRYNYDTGDVKDRHTYSGDDAGQVARRKDEKQKDERHRDDRHRDKYREEGDKDSRDRYEKQKDDYSEKDRNGSRSDKYQKSERDTADDRQRKSKPRDSDRDHYKDKERDHGRDRDRDYDNSWDRDHDGDCDRERVRDQERDRDSVREKERYQDSEHDQERHQDRDKDLDDYSATRYKDHRGKKRSPDDRGDDYSDSRPRSTKARNSETEKRSVSSSRVEADDRGRSQSHQGHLESSRRRGSPASSSHGGVDDSRLAKEDTKYKESVKKSRPKAISPRESVLSGPTDRGSKYPSYDRNSKMDDGRVGEFSAERSSSSKASPMGLSERSPSATSLERRNTSRNAVRRNLDIEEQGRKTGASADGRDLPVPEGRLSRDRPIEKPSVDELTQADSSFHNKPGFSNTSSISAPPPRSGTEASPFPSLLSEEDNRANTNVRFRRNNDSGAGRGHGNNWRGVHNWSSPMPNGFMPFQHGPHGNFQAMMPHFPSPSIFAVRPPMEINQSGMHYHLPDAERYPGHLRPFGWQNMIDTSGLPRFHGWDGSGVLRDEPHMYPGPDWDQNRHMMNVRGWETSNTETWKGHNNGDVSMDPPSISRKEEQPVPTTDPANDGSASQGQGSDKGNSQQKALARSLETKQENHSPVKEIPKSPSSKTRNDARPDLSELAEGNDGMNLCRAYLSNLDISVELADPESYKQYVGIVDVKKTVIVDETPSGHMILAGYGRVLPQSSGASLSALMFPAVSKSITQKAIDIYRKQRLEPWSIPVAVGGLVDLISSIKDMDKTDDQPPENLHEEVLNSGTLSPDEKKVEEPDEIVDDSTKELLMSTEESGDAKVQLMDMDDISLVETEASSGNKVSVPLVVDVGSSGEAVEEALIPDSNESKLVNLSRIHDQSPESTH